MISEILDFMLRHWQLSGLLLILTIVYIIFEFKQSLNRTEISAEAAIDLYNHHEAVLLDIRPQAAFNEGHIVGATHIGADVTDLSLKRFQKYAQKPVIVISADGRDTSKFVTRLTGQGLQKVLSLNGGMNAWRSAGLPLTK